MPKSAYKHFVRCDSHDYHITPLYITLLQMNACANDLDNYNKYVNLLVFDEELLKNIMRYGIKLKIYLKKNLIVIQCITINI